MPVPGRKPKKDSRYGNTAPSKQARQEWYEVPNEPYKGPVPALPKQRAGNRTWPARCRQKWKVWSSMPHCVLWEAAEWDFAIDSLEVAAQWYETGQANKATELRNREKILGTTLDFRRALRIRYVDPNQLKEKASEDVPNIDDYRGRTG